MSKREEDEFRSFVLLAKRVREAQRNAKLYGTEGPATTARALELQLDREIQAILANQGQQAFSFK